MDAYVRVSKVGGREGPSYISPSVQESIIQAYATAHGVNVGETWTDENESGGNQQRPGIKEAIRRVEAGESDGIICAKLDRYGRNVIEALQDVERIEAAGGRVVWVEDNIDSSTDSGKMHLTIMLSMAEYQLKGLKAGLETAQKRAVARGAFVGKTPIGYMKQRDGSITPSEDAPIIREIYRKAGQLGAQAALAYAEQELPHRHWSLGNLRRLLASRTYLGESSCVKEVNREAHTPLVTRVEWEAAQIDKRFARLPNLDYPLTGLITCAGCGGRMVGGRGGSAHRIYRCKSTRSPKDACPAPAYIAAEPLERYLKARLEEIGRDDWGVASTPPGELTELRAAVDDAEAELEAFAADLTARRLLGNDYHASLELRVKARDMAQDALRDAAKGSVRTERLPSAEALDSAHPEELRNLYSVVFPLIEVSRGRAAIDRRVRVLQQDDVAVAAA